MYQHHKLAEDVNKTPEHLVETNEEMYFKCTLTLRNEALENLIIFPLFKKLLALYGTRSFITVLMVTRHWSLS